MKIRALALDYATTLKQRLAERQEEMSLDDTAHYMIYHILGISSEECWHIDYYQNVGRFVYRYAGGFLEQATYICLKEKYPTGRKERIPNQSGTRPATYEIDFLNEQDAIEIKWRDATTDGDHIAKEYARAKAIKDCGYIPIRVMYYYPQRGRAQRIQEAVESMYKGLGGAYYYGDEAWSFIERYTGVDLKKILSCMAEEK